jgi:hemerythrin
VTTTLSDIRTTLLKQHADIRAQIEETREAAAGKDAVRQRACLARLVDTMQRHNVAEESVLRAILPTLDAWGPVRQKTMLDEHLAEHTELFATLVEASCAPDPTAASGVIVKLLDRMLVHMAHEEKEFLGAELLTDETPCDGFGG